jgi:beta-glucosidase
MEGHDRSSAKFAGHQLGLAAAMRMSVTGVPLICVLIHGASMILGTLTTNCDAIVDGWQPGGQGGRAMADVLFGNVSPAGRSPQTFYTSEATFPPPGDMGLHPNSTAHTTGWTYRYSTGAIDIPFGFGLSYTTFEYTHLQISQPMHATRQHEQVQPHQHRKGVHGGPANSSPFNPCDQIDVEVTVKNVGAVGSDEVVQVYLQQESPEAPLIRLAAFVSACRRLKS